MKKTISSGGVLWWLLFAVLFLVLALGVLLMLKPRLAVVERKDAVEGILAALSEGESEIVVDPDALQVAGEDAFTDEIDALFQSDPYGQIREEASTLTLLGEILIPKIELHLPISEGAHNLQLRYGAAHVELSALPGQPGTCVLLGHRMLEYGDQFNRFGELEEGDEIYLRNLDGERFDYTVTRIEIVRPSEVQNALYFPAEEKLLALITCDPIETAANRMIVWCEQTDSK